MYILPAIDILDGKAVRLAKGDYARVTTYNANPLDQAKLFESQGATWLHVVDLDGAKAGTPINTAAIEQIATHTTLHVEVGGGLRTMDALRHLRECGVARMVLGTALVRDPAFADAAIAAYGEALACGIDARDGEVAVTGWTEGSGIAAADLAAQLAARGYAHMVYTDIARDGMQTGIDAAAYAEMALTFGHPVIASGGVANIEDIRALAALNAQNAEEGLPPAIEGVIAGRAIYEGSLDLEEAISVVAASAPAE